MKISFILPFINWTGGIRVVFEYAERLQRRGHELALYFPLIPYWFNDRLYTFSGLRRWLGDLALNLRRKDRQKWFDLTAPLVMAPWISDRFIADADAVVATAWPTAYSVSKLDSVRGAKFYLVQGYEAWSGPSGAVDGSYRLRVHKIVVASWLRDMLRDKFGQPILGVVTNGVDFSLFYPDWQDNQGPLRVLMQYSPLECKGVADGLKAWRIVRAERPDVQLVMFGLRRGPDVPSDVEFHQDPSQDELRRLYNSCDVFVSTSWTEGCQLPPAEAMACGRAVVATKVGAVPDYAIPGKTALVVEPRDVHGMGAAILRLLRDDNESSRIAQAGYHHIRRFTWERATEQLEDALMRGLELTRATIQF